MSSNLVEITVTAENIVEVLKNLKFNSDFSSNCSYTLSVEIENIKENYEYLVNSKKIISWSIIDKKSPDNSKPKDNISIYDYIIQHNLINPYNINDICKLIDSFWIAKMNNPSADFSVDFFHNKVEPIYNNISISYDYKFLEIIGGLSITNKTIFILNKLKEKWNQIINCCDFNEVIKLLLN